VQELEGFPIVDDGLVMTHYPGLLVVRLEQELTQAAFERYCEAWLRAVDARPSVARVAAIYEMPTWPGLTASQRQRWGQMLKSRHAVLQRTTVGMALASPSIMVRAALTGVFWLAPPPYAHTVVDAPCAAFEWVGSRLGDVDVRGCLQAYEQLLASRAFRRPPPARRPEKAALPGDGKAPARSRSRPW
jgi:hypothetical protein